LPRKSSEQILAELQAEPDGRLTRNVGIWSLEKLAMLLLYFGAFSTACRDAGGGYYVDGMAGPGLCKVRNAQLSPQVVWGSALLALRTTPKLRHGFLMELKPRKAETLRTRCEPFGNRASVVRGDVNADLVPLLRSELPRRAPAFCLLDPEGPELQWRTVTGISRLPNRVRKPELLILFPLDMAILRLLTVHEEMADEDVERIDLMFGDEGWRDIYRARLEGGIMPNTAKQMYLDLYTNNVRKLGYKVVLAKSIVAPRSLGAARRPMYHLVFATDHPAGQRIMQDVFERPYVLGYPVSGQTSMF